MNLSAFFEHWRITENPFRGEEARQDPVFLRLEGAHLRSGPTSVLGSGPAATLAAEPGSGSADGDRSITYAASASAAPPALPTTHSDFEKIAGEFDRPSTSIVFGEKGSGKTAIRLQLTDRVAAYNRAHPAARCLLIAYDDLNPILDRFVERVGLERKGTVLDTLGKFRLVDHVDALLGIVVPKMVDTLLMERQDQETLDLGAEPRRTIRKLETGVRHEALVLQAVYDRPDHAEARSARLRRVLRLPRPVGEALWSAAAWAGWVVPVGVLIWGYANGYVTAEENWFVYTVLALAAVYLAVLAKRAIWDRLRFLSLGHRLRKQVRVVARSDASFARSARQLDPTLLDGGTLPLTASDDVRYAMLDRLRRVLRPFGYVSVLVVVDRVDEPTVISGDPERMRAVIWPLLNNKFLQQPGLGIKMLLPMELRHALFRESAAFFQEARLDKQNLIERLSWTGAMLYDLCNARLQACRAPGAEPISLLDLFAEDVTRQDLVDALDQMHQPRDAFKFLYQCLTEHCSNVTQEQAQWRIPRLVLELVRKAQTERVQQLYKGVRPA